MRCYTTQADDVLDEICFKYYSQDAGNTEAVLEQNPMLSRYPAHLPAGLSIKLPDLEIPTEPSQLIQLWD